jgi:DNA polymerase III subunit beta
MRLKILQQDLNGPLQSISRSVGVKASLPVLGNILFEAEGNKLKLSATNLEVGVIKQINAEVLEGGAITVPAKTLNEVISSLSGLEIEFYTEGELLKIEAGKFKADLNGIASSEFPAIPQTEAQGFKIPKAIFKDSIPQISFASAVDEGRPVLTGILTEIKNSRFEVVATDGFRLAHKTFSNEKLVGIDFKALIPRKTLDELVRLIGEETEEFEEVTLATTDNQNQVVFNIGSTILSSRLIEGNFPSWEKIIPPSFVSHCVINKDELIKGLKLASVFARSEANVIKLKLSPQGIRLTSETRELGHQDAQVGAEVTGEELEVAFNSKYLLDAVSACPGPELKIQFSGSLSPTKVCPTAEQGLEYIVMPIRIN